MASGEDSANDNKKYWDEKLSVKTVIQNRHTGTWGSLSAMQKVTLFNATVSFLKSNNLPIASELKLLEIPRVYQEKYNQYLDLLVDKNIFSYKSGGTVKKDKGNVYILH